MLTVKDYKNSIIVQGNENNIKIFEVVFKLFGGIKNDKLSVGPAWIFYKYLQPQLEKLADPKEQFRAITIFYNKYTKYYNYIEKCMTSVSKTLNLTEDKIEEELYLSIFSSTPQSRMIIDKYPKNLMVRGIFDPIDNEEFLKIGGRYTNKLKKWPHTGYSFPLFRYKLLEGYLLTGRMKKYREPGWRLTKKERMKSIVNCKKRLESIINSIVGLKKPMNGKKLTTELRKYANGDCSNFFEKIISRLDAGISYSKQVIDFIIDSIEGKTIIENGIEQTMFISPFHKIYKFEVKNDVDRKYVDEYYKNIKDKLLFVQSVSIHHYPLSGDKELYIIQVMKGTN